MNAAVFHLIQVNWVLMSKQAQGVAGGGWCGVTCVITNHCLVFERLSLDILFLFCFWEELMKKPSHI